MNEKIHFSTIARYFSETYGCNLESKYFENKKTGEKYDVFCEHNADLAFFTVKPSGEYLCLDSDGNSVDPHEIMGYITFSEVIGSYNDIKYTSDKLELNYHGKSIDKDALLQLEKVQYPERPGIVLNTMFSGDNEVRKFIVNEVQYVDNKMFEKIICQKNVDVLRQYNNKRYEYISNAINGILVINGETGDGLLVDTQGYDYARYMSYAPQIQAAIEQHLTYGNEMDQQEQTQNEQEMGM